jgi:hypothetical protein
VGVHGVDGVDCDGLYRSYGGLVLRAWHIVTREVDVGDYLELTLGFDHDQWRLREVHRLRDGY